MTLTLPINESAGRHQTSVVKHFERKSQCVFLSVLEALDKDVLTKWGISLINGCNFAVEMQIVPKPFCTTISIIVLLLLLKHFCMFFIGKGRQPGMRQGDTMVGVCCGYFLLFFSV